MVSPNKASSSSSLQDIKGITNRRMYKVFSELNLINHS